MAGNEKETWITWIALSTAIMAVFSAVTTLYVGKYSSRAVLYQGQETDQWAYYQAKSIKSHAYELQKQKLEIEIAAGKGRLSAEAVDQYRKAIADYDSTVKRYEKEKAEIKAGAEELARKKELAQREGTSYSYSLIFLQIAIMLSSVSALTRKKPLWFLGLLAVTGWVFFFLNALLLFY